MVLRRRWLPPVANLQQLNPHLAVEGTGLEIPRIGRAWQANQTRIAGVSSFGWSGTNVHVVLEEAAAAGSVPSHHNSWPVVVSAQAPEAVRQLAENFAERLDSADSTELAAISYASTIRRTAHACRIAVQGSQPQEVARLLRQRIIDPDPRIGSGEAKQDERLLRWERGGDIDWSAFFPEPIPIVDLPLYPFQGREHWIEEKQTPRASQLAIQDSPGSAHPSSFAPDDWLYSVDLVAEDLEVRGTPRSHERATWVLLGRETELGRQLASAVRSRGAELVEGFAQRSTQHEGSRGKWLAEIVSRCGGKGPHYVVYFPKHDAPSALTAEALGVVQALLSCEGSARLWFVVELPERPPSMDGLVSSALHGFTRVAGLEHPTRIGGIIAADSGSAPQVCEEIDGDASDDNVLLRAGLRFVPRLHRDRFGRREPLQLREDRSYLVTGAFGAIGMDVAAWMVAAGARHLVLAGRRDPSVMGKPEMLERLDAWRAAGIEVRTCVCDVADESQVAKMLADIDAGDASLAGVIHAAAHMRFSCVERATVEDVQDAFRAKLDGAQVLDRCTRARPLDFFVLFSSGAATLGLRNGAIYAAANSALLGVAEERRALGLPALCVEWGSWVSDHAGAQSALIENSGFISMQPQTALLALAAMIQERRFRGVVADVDWQILGPALALRGRDALVSPVLPDADEQGRGSAAVSAVAWVDSLRSLSTAEQREHLLDLVGSEARGVFGMQPEDSLQEDRGLFAIGMDSLMAVRLKRRLEERTGLRLPGTVTLTYPTLAALTGYLQNRLFGGESAVVPSPARTASNVDVTKLAAMDDDETRAAIEEELAAVQQTLSRKQR
jgi:myxalamid-type polyketide synthase MxaE and MxaD